MRKVGKKLTFALFIFIFCFCVPVSPALSFDTVEQGAGATHEIMEYIYNHHINRPDVDVLTEGAIRGMIETLHDPYTEYLSPGDLSKFVSSLDGEFSGIGVELEAQEPYPAVTRVITGSPAAAAGLRVGDQIVKVDGEDVAGRPLSEVVFKIRGPRGSLVRLTIRRAGAGQFDVEVKRAAIAGPTCQWRVVGGNVGYIYVHTFGTRTAREFQEALEELRKAGVKGLILDLRNDPGGYLQAAVDIAGCFLPSGKLVVTTEDRDGDRQEYKTAGTSAGYNLPLVILVNGYSASAAEVLAGALADYQVATLVGTRSYGKGVVQAVIPLQAGGALKMTIARYLTPRGISIDKNGLKPDRVVSTPELQVVVARQLIDAQETRQLKFAADGKGVFIDGEKIAAGPAPLLLENEIYLPLRFTLEAIGYEVEWRESTGVIAIKGGDKKFFFSASEQTLLLKDGRAYLKADFFRLIKANIYQEAGYIILDT